MPAFNSTNFPAFFNATRASKLTGVDYILNQAQKNSYPMMMLIRGQNPFSMVQGGSSITELYKSSDTGTFGAFNPGERASINIVDTSKTLTFYWRFYRSHVAWTDEEFLLNTKGGQFAQVKRFRDLKEADRVSEHLRGFDNLLFARPNGDTMEAASAGSGGACFSLPCFITENSNRYLPPSSVWSQSTVGGGNPSTDSNWRPRRNTYVHTTPDDPNVGIFAAWDSILLDMQYEAVPEASAATQAATSSDLVCFTNKDGVIRLTQSARAAQDKWVKPNDAGSFGQPTFDGIPIVRAPQLDTELLEVDGYGSSADYTGAAYTSGKPRYYIVNKKNAHPVFADEGAGGVLNAEPAARDPVNYPDLTVVWTKTFLNLAFNSRNRHGIICPATPGA